MKLIVECGATKSDWSLVDGCGLSASFQTEGLNFSSGNEEFVYRTLELAVLKTKDIADGEPVSAVCFYAAGLFPSENADSPYMMLNSYFGGTFPDAEIHLENDLLAAARAVCGHRKGIAAILGTGSNSCVFDGTRITRRQPSGGFILGDEGSASALGRAFVSDYIKGLVPETVRRAIAEKYDMEYSSLVWQVYHGASPAGFLGKFAPDILSFYDQDRYIKNLVDDNFRAFFERCLKPCLDFDATVVGIVGGFGHACRNIIDAIAEEYGIKIDKYLPSPSEELIKYHYENH